MAAASLQAQNSSHTCTTSLVCGDDTVSLLPSPLQPRCWHEANLCITLDALHPSAGERVVLTHEPFMDLPNNADPNCIVVRRLDGEQVANVAQQENHAFLGRPLSYGTFLWMGRTSRRSPLRMLVHTARQDVPRRNLLRLAMSRA